MKRQTNRQRDRLDAHIFVCTNTRGSEHACCADADGEAVVEAVKRWLQDRDLFWSSVSVGTTSCLGLCSEGGAALTIQPRDEWFSDVRPEDVPDLLAGEFGSGGDR
ncbi:(2Fe-2S) ferredoxin domain-containing protein [Halegenticoccus soli]|uniref:(2Fe-2S) ferredoxin domain-containing protein n=1 Tax=Halegenticoccus soli TaxID=1985678 RepID=UPI000C6C8A48|nr:(2Fe-2S) ferredoxin domain-containing protein [Halegenticoccus soli]